MNPKKSKRKGKRFIAGFLALLMAVTLLPANTLSAAYAEELDAIEAEVSDSIVAADEETQAVDSDAVIDEDMPHVNEEENFKTVYVKVEPKANKVNYISEAGKELTTSYDVVRAEKKDLSGAKILLQDEKGKTAKAAYTGNAVTPYKAVIKIKGLEDITIILDGNGADYESKGFKVTYANNTLKGKATIVIEATSGNTSFVGSNTAAFSIVRKN